ncbi:polysaccharide deacetylase family protein [Clostridium sp. YIM B02551]|uniref:polysaccharide deacetylase family protein n=1 Tax=Clostridium sp. YIM B02551 TaxID=2910679 RepID=UPI001EEB20CE|nr:polysaccharide deacetylase family protein [Clostridium sp. YIM B02551]
MTKSKFTFFITLFLLFTLNFIPCYGMESEEKVIYITFDDGPTKVSNKVLDVLDEYGVKATFFLIGEQIQRNRDVVFRMYENGHSIGLHSYTHSRNKIYSSRSSFLDEMKKTQKELEELTGYKSTILRFPFGCNNNMYKLDNKMVDMLHSEGLKIFDWNVDSKDGAIQGLSSYDILKNSKTDKNRIILLLHCSSNNKNTVKALPSIIKYYKEKGYTFKTIDANTDEQFRVIKKS